MRTVGMRAPVVCRCAKSWNGWRNRFGRLTSAGTALRISLGLVFVWFGALKILNLSPALDLVRDLSPRMAAFPFFECLGVFECALGVVLVSGFATRVAALVTMAHLAGTFALVPAAPRVLFTTFPLLSMSGEFVLKNVVLFAAAAEILLITLRSAHVASRTVLADSSLSSVSFEGVLVDRCDAEGCWVAIRGERGDFTVDLREHGLRAEKTLALGGAVRIRTAVARDVTGGLAFRVLGIDPHP